MDGRRDTSLQESVEDPARGTLSVVHRSIGDLVRYARIPGQLADIFRARRGAGLAAVVGLRGVLDTPLECERLRR